MGWWIMDSRVNYFEGQYEDYYNKYSEYYKEQNDNNQRCSFFEGNCEATIKSFAIFFHEMGGQNKKFFLTINIESFIGLLSRGDRMRNYDGGLCYALKTSDGSFSTQFFKMVTVRRDKGCHFSLDDENVKKTLDITESDGTKAILTKEMDSDWYNVILNSINK